MKSFFSNLGYRQKGLLAEVIYLFFIGIVSPFAVGLQIFNSLAFTLSLVLVNILQLPFIIIFYRIYLPNTIGKRKYLLALMLFPVYILLYELGTRVSFIAAIHLDFLPLRYRENLALAHPEDFSGGYFNQSLGYTCLVLLAATSLYVVKLLFKNQHNLNSISTAKLELELSQLKSQIQPHFFFNTLNNMYALSVDKSPDTPRMVQGLSSVMRYILYDSGSDKVALSKEVGFMRSYIQLESFRHSPQNLIEFTVQGDTDGITIAPLIFMPLIENTFKHALHRETKEKWVKIVLSVEKTELIFQTTNPLLAPDPSHGYGGLGLQNVGKRLALLYPNQHELRIYREDGTFTVTLIIKLI